MGNDRKKEVIDICLDHFVQKGLSETSTRSLSAALKLQNAGLYYYFSSKDEAVIACAEEAAVRIENKLIDAAILSLDTPDEMMLHLQKMSEELAPLMKFFVSVCVSSRYQETIRPTIGRLAERYECYAKKFAQKLGCTPEVAAPYVYMGITAISGYMIFGELGYIMPQLELLKKAVTKLCEKRGNPL